MQRKKIINGLTILFFIISVIEIIAEYLSDEFLIYALKPVIPLLIIILYSIESSYKNKIFIIAMLFSLFTNILFIPNSATYLYYGIIAFLIHRILIVFLLLRINPIKDFIPFLLATAPFLLIFFYLLLETEDVPDTSLPILICLNILISIFAGIALSNYVMNDNKQNSILLISAFLFVLLQFVVFIEKYFLIYEFKEIFRPLAMILNVFAFFTLYKYMIEEENAKQL